MWLTWTNFYIIPTHRTIFETAVKRIERNNNNYMIIIYNEYITKSN